ncbi:MAG TPA: hydroxysqualene dehydroxylase HpnE [Thermomicrobiaceae bacterium]|nr:hydroxysqualene dehydroxylase HpnE [Thermomicrobiaceae bacterium]
MDAEAAALPVSASYVVVGAGLAGLSAAVALKAAGHAVELIERTRLLGGKATSFTVDGIEVDNGQHVFLGCCSDFIAFVEDVWRRAGRATGLSPSPLWLQERFDVLLLAPGQSPARMRARDLPAPLHLTPALLAYPLLAPADRLRLGAALLLATQPADPTETFADWLTRHGQGDAILDAFWHPFIVPALNAALDQVAATDALYVIRTAFLSDRHAACFGFSRLPLARIAEAAAGLVDQVRMRTSVSSIEAGEGGADRVRLRLSDGESIECDGVVLAVPPRNLAQILGDHQRFGLSGLDAFQTAPIIDVHLWYDRPELGFGFAALVGSPVQWVFEKAPGYLCCSLSAAEELIHKPSDELASICRAELGNVLPELAGQAPAHSAVTRDREATFVPAPGLRRPGQLTNRPNIVIAGAWTDTGGWPATMESAVRSGKTAARILNTRARDRRTVGCSEMTLANG